MRERPILFSAPLVRAILNGSKRVTRRPVKLRDDECYRYDPFGRVLGHMAVRDGDESDWRNIRELGAPYGAPGDRLWVRETFYVNHIDHVRGKLPNARPIDELTDQPVEILYRADGDFDEHFEQVDAPELAVWRPSLHMPRWASRILLEVTDVRVERLQDITEEDVYAEGVEVPVTDDGCPPGKVQPLHRLTGKHPTFGYAAPGAPGADVVRAHFASAWESIYGAGSWAANGHVWRIAFKRIEPPIDRRETRFSNAPGGGVCQCLNDESPSVCDGCEVR